MWIKGAPLLLVRLRPWWLFCTVALYVPEQLLLAWEPLFALVPGAPGAWLRRAAATLQAILLKLMYGPPQTIADIRLSREKQRIGILVRTWGLGGGGGNS